VYVLRPLTLEDLLALLHGALAEQARAIPDAPFFLWEGRAWSYREADQRTSRAAHVLWRRGVRAKQRVGILMDNHPDYLVLLAALSRLSAVAVLLPAEARGRSLAHAADIADLSLLVTGPAHAAAVRETLPKIPALLIGAARAKGQLPADLLCLDDEIEAAPPALPDGVEVDRGRADEVALLLFTSGTTGLPKAARISNRRCILGGLGAAAGCALTPADTVYCCLPLYHATALLVAAGGALIGGSRLALAPRFSQSTFWADVRKTGATVVFYVGEMCRYLVTASPAANERSHPVRLFCGNGMRPDVWTRLGERFGRARVLEFYGSTEGNVLLVNLAGEKVGSVGRPIGGEGDLALLRYDAERAQPTRDGKGRGVRVGDDEPGLLVARIHKQSPLGHFDGYTDSVATEARILRDLFAPGDAWFSTGDVLRRDSDGDYWYADRLGDSFRWKGENVSTDQVAQVLCEAPFIALAVVYGVAVPGREGRAGMAAIQLAPEASFDGRALAALCEAHLPPAARPRWLRVSAQLEATPSFKLKKTELQAEGCDPARIADPLYVYDEAAHTYRPLTGDPFALV
jgi:acyl-CoA synthetase (AMP-forming)/AMP-acid ligase II